VSLRLTDDEHRTLLARAHALGLTLSDYLRQVALREVGDAAAAR
jgi:hypothetical protein